MALGVGPRRLVWLKSQSLNMDRCWAARRGTFRPGVSNITGQLSLATMLWLFFKDL